ncbi:alkene reductase [Mycobacteroides abscessus]
MTSTIFDTVKLGQMDLSNRLAMAPMTRSRAKDDGTPTLLNAEYYAQRSGFGLVIAEGTQPSEQGQGYLNSPGIYTSNHVDGWRSIADAVHSKGGKIFVQLMHVGRVAHPLNTQHGTGPVAPSSIPLRELQMFTSQGMKPIPVAREMSISDIEQAVNEFAHASRCAMAAGLDGVELHGANGYLLQQFLAPNTNARTDRYGGDLDNRQRFVIEVARRVAEEIGPERTGIRLSPGGTVGEIDEGADYVEEYVRLAEKLSEIPLVYLHIAFLRPTSKNDDELLKQIRAVYGGVLIVNRGGRPVGLIGQEVSSGLADMESIGALALANPDLPLRLENHFALNQPQEKFFYGGGPEGYTDYPEYRS